jgi:hypothetical protein
MKRLLLIAPVLLLLVACAKPIYNVDKAAFVTGSGSTPSLAEVRGAIIAAATSKGWTVQDIDPTHLKVTLNIREHMAQVVVEYSANFFSITYLDSVNLGHDGNNIHRNYNRWIRNMEVRIKERIVAL